MSCSQDDTAQQSIIEIYRLLVEMADRVSQRRQSANAFYLSVNTAIIGGTALLAQAPLSYGGLAVSTAGIAICILWIRAVLSYKSLNAAKFAVITAVEERLPIKPYSEEWAILDPDGDGKRHTPFHKTEVLVPVVFLCVHAVQMMMEIPWEPVAAALKAAIFTT